MLTIFLAAPLSVMAQGGMQGMDMQSMMQAAQQMQQCMAKVDQQAMQKMQRESNKVVGELRSLCQQGKKSEAQAKAISYSKQMISNPAIQQMRKCGEMAKGFMPKNMQQNDFFDDFENSKHHVCDSKF